jgi:hypothetical protein
MIGYSICCQQFNFLNSTLDMVKWSVDGHGHVYQAPTSTLAKLKHLYLVPFLIVSTFVVARKAVFPHRSMCFAAMSYLGITIVFYVSYMFSTRTALLELFFYFSFLLVPSILCMIFIPVILARSSASEFQQLNFALVLVLLLPLVIAYGFPDGLDRISIYWIWLGFAFTLILVLLATSFKEFSAYAILCFSLVIQISILSGVSWSSASDGIPVYARMYGMVDDVGMSRYRLGLKFIEAVPKFNQEYRPVYFWYSNADKLAHSLQSTYLWGYSRLMDSNQGTPGLPFSNGVNIESLHKRSSLVLFDREKRIVNQGIEELRSLGIRFAVKKFHEICERETCYTIAFVDVKGGNEKIERDWNAGAYRELGIVVNWNPPGIGAQIAYEGPITVVSTPAKAWNYAAVATVKFSEPLTAGRGLVRVIVIVKDAAAGLGFLGSDESRFIKNVDVHPSTEPQELYFEIDNLSELKNFVVQSWNRNRSARVQILEFAIRVQLSP